MHKISLLFASAVTAIMLIAPSTHAQTASGALIVVDSAGNALAAQPLFDGIQLSKAQQDSIDVITHRYSVLFDAVNREDAGVRIRQRQFLVLREKSRAEKRAVLTPAQQPIYDKNAAAQKANDDRVSKELIKTVEGRTP